MQGRIITVISTEERSGNVVLRPQFSLRQPADTPPVQELLTGRTRLPEFAAKGEWKTYRLGDVMQRHSRSVDWDDNEKYRLISIRRRNGGIFLREAKFGRDIRTKQLFEVREGDFALSRMQVVHGAWSIVTPEFSGSHVSGMYMLLRPRRPVRVRTEFLHHLSHLPQLYHAALLSCYGVHIEKMTFNPKLFLRKQIRVPPTIEEQDRISMILALAEQEIRALERLRGLLRLQQRGLMQKLLSGELEVPESVRETMNNV